MCKGHVQMERILRPLQEIKRDGPSTAEAVIKGKGE